MHHDHLCPAALLLPPSACALFAVPTPAPALVAATLVRRAAAEACACRAVTDPQCTSATATRARPRSVIATAVLDGGAAFWSCCPGRCGRGPSRDIALRGVLALAGRWTEASWDEDPCPLPCPLLMPPSDSLRSTHAG